jgi:hypothetical protein
MRENQLLLTEKYTDLTYPGINFEKSLNFKMLILEFHIYDFIQ